MSYPNRRSVLGMSLGFTSLIGAFLIQGCGATPNRMTHLRDSLRTFNQQVRWGRWGGAATLVVPEIRDSWMSERMRGGKGIKITDVKLLGVESDGPRATEAKVLIGIAYYRESDMTVSRSIWKQEWTHTRDGWQLKSEERHVDEAPEETLPEPSWP